MTAISSLGAGGFDRYDQIVWDSDGVLVDSKLEAWRAASEIVRLLGVDVEIRSQDQFRRYFVEPGVVSDNDVGKLRDVHRLVMRSRSRLVQPFPCARLVARLKAPSRILTSGSATFARDVLGDQALLFQNIQGAEDGTKKALLDGISGRLLFITDTAPDIAQYRSRGQVIAVGWGYDSLPELQKADPEYIAPSTDDLKLILEQLGLLTP